MLQNGTKWRGARRLIVGAIAVGTFCTVPNFAGPRVWADSSDNAQSPTTQQSAMSLPSGFKQTDVTAASDLRNELVKLTDRAFSKGQYDHMLDELSTRAKEQARQYKDADQANLDRTIAAIQTEWRSKYGQDLAVNDKTLTFGDQYAVVQGEVEDPAVAMSNWPVSPTTGQPINASEQMNAQNQNPDQAKQAADAGLDKGRGVALMRFPGHDGKPDVTVSFLHEILAGWTIDLPRDRSGQQIYQDFSTQLSDISAHADQWPADVNDGYRMLTCRVLDALYGVSGSGTMNRQ